MSEQSDKYKNELTALKSFMDNMPAFSPATKKLIELSNNLDASPKDIVKAIRMDPVLTGRVFEIINSSYYGLPDKVTSLNRAVVYMGINTIKNIALSATMTGALSTKNQEIIQMIRPLWRHSLATGVVAKTMAKSLDVEKSMIEEYFIAGLLHEIGKIILIQCFFNYETPYNKRLTMAEERERYGLGHNEIAHAILHKWNFGEELAYPLSHSHHPEGDCKMGYILHVANYMTYKMGLNEANDRDQTPDEETETDSVDEEQPLKSPSKDDYIPNLVKNAWDELGISEKELEKVLEGAPREIEKAEAFLKV